MQRFYSWEGRCYQEKYGNKNMLNFYLSGGKDLFEFLKTFKNNKYVTPVDILDKKVEKHVDNEEGTGYDCYSVTLVIEEKDKNRMIVYLEKEGFKYI